MSVSDSNAPPSDPDASTDLGSDRAEGSSVESGGASDEAAPESRPPLRIDPVDVRDLLRKALDPPVAGRPPALLRKVQRQIREETQGRFFADGWSTSSAPRATYLVTALVMLAVTAALWWLLRPQGIELLP